MRGCWPAHRRQPYPHRVYTYVALAMYDATDCGVGIEVLLQPASPQRAGSRPAHRLAGPRQPVLSVRACGGGTGGGDRARVFSAGGSAVLSDHGRTGGLVSRAGRPSIPQRLLRRTRARPESGRASHRQSQGGWLGRRLDRNRADRPVQMDRHQSRQRHRRELETAAAHLAEPVQTPASAGVRLARGAGRGGDGSQLSHEPS